MKKKQNFFFFFIHLIIVSERLKREFNFEFQSLISLLILGFSSSFNQKEKKPNSFFKKQFSNVSGTSENEKKIIFFHPQSTQI